MMPRHFELPSIPLGTLPVIAIELAAIVGIVPVGNRPYGGAVLQVGRSGYLREIWTANQLLRTVT